MKSKSKRIVIVLLIVLLAAGIVSESLAEWHIILNENFNRDPRNIVWPWRTPGPGGTWVWWAFNTRNWPTATQTNYAPSNCGWGLQDEYFNTQVTPDADDQAALWCAYSTQQGPNAPQWPDEDEYWNGSNAWAWWGPFSLEDAESARLSYWYWIHADNLTRDSLSVVLLNGDRYIGSSGVDFRSRCGFGNTHPAPLEDWVRRDVYAESLMVNGRDASFLGEEEVFIAFVWQSDGNHHDGTGAYIDDVIVAWDDGLFDLRHTFMQFGYPEGEDEFDWTNRGPKLYDEVLLRLSYEVVGSNEFTDPFTIDCYIDDELFYRERVETRQGDLDTTYHSITENFWVADSGEHIIRWELDTPVDDGGAIEESNEGNNVRETICEVEWNPKPQFEIITPAQVPSYVKLNEAYPIHWTISDSNEWDQYFDVFFFMTNDTSGWSEYPQVIYNEETWRLVSIQTAVEAGEYITYFTPIEPFDSLGDSIYIAGVATDGYPANFTFSLAPGAMEVSLGVDPSDSSPVQALDYSLDQAYPNPFNRMVMISFSLPVAGSVNLAVYDLAGRLVTTLVDGVKQSGQHISTWKPDNIPGGVYMLRMEAGERSFVQKVVYMP